MEILYYLICFSMCACFKRNQFGTCSTVNPDCKPYKRFYWFGSRFAL